MQLLAFTKIRNPTAITFQVAFSAIATKMELLSFMWQVKNNKSSTIQ
jgi:hypothetical protein